MIAGVWYTVPVVALVDTETGEVTRVVCIDEAIAPENGPSGSPVVMASDYSQPVEGPDAKRAIEIAEDAAEWPGWEFGF